MKDSVLLVGIGSAMGDDRVGWEVGRHVALAARPSVRVRCAGTPLDLLDWLDGIDRLEVCDALACGAPGSIRRWSWPAEELECPPLRSSHGISLPAALRLAETLGRLPRRVTIWGIAIDTAWLGETLSPGVASAVPLAVRGICGALADA